MALLERITKETTGHDAVRDFFNRVENAVGTVPETFTTLANSPALFEAQVAQIGYYQNHPALSPELLAFIRYTSACWFKNKACIDFNGTILKKQGMTEQELAGIIADPESAPLEDKEKAMLKFVYRGVKDQDSASRQDMENLRALGWNNSDIVDAVSHGFFMYAPGKILELFKMI